MRILPGPRAELGQSCAGDVEQRHDHHTGPVRTLWLLHPRHEDTAAEASIRQQARDCEPEVCLD